MFGEGVFIYVYSYASICVWWGRNTGGSLGPKSLKWLYSPGVTHEGFELCVLEWPMRRRQGLRTRLLAQHSNARDQSKAHTAGVGALHRKKLSKREDPNHAPRPPNNEPSAHSAPNNMARPWGCRFGSLCKESENSANPDPIQPKPPNLLVHV